MPKEKLLTENQVVGSVKKYLKKKKWIKIKCCYNHKKGNDIEAIKNNKLLIIEAKGARPNPKSPNAKHKKFLSNQIKIHFGEAIVKIMEQMTKHPNAKFGIAQPDTDYIKKCLKDIIPQIKQLKIKLFWVQKDGQVLINN